MEKVSIIGMGEIGVAIYDDINKKRKVELFGVENNTERIIELSKKGYLIGMTPRQSNVYIVCVYTTDQVFEVLRSINYENQPLVSLESTINPESLKEICDLAEERKFDLVAFPHRYNPNDSEHRIFNLHRLLGAHTQKAQERATNFYQQFMPQELIHCVPIEIATLSKIVENAYRFFEISFAQQLKKICDQKEIDFETLRAAANTKWNIDIKEARDGIRGKCLPKDISILSQYSQENPLLKLVLRLNEEYCKKHS